MRTHYKKMGLRLLLMVMAIVSYLPAWADDGTEPVTEHKVTCVQSAMTATVPEAAPSGQPLVIEMPSATAGKLFTFAVYSDGKLVEGCTVVADADKSTLTIPAVTADIEIYLQGYYVYDKDSWLSYGVVPAGWYSEKGYAMVTGRKYSRDLVRYTVLESITYDGKAYDVRRIHADAFKDGDSKNKLHYLMLPASIDTIGARAFEDCSNLSVICVKNPKAVYVSDGAFAGVDRAKCTVYVPKGNLAAYKDWGGFTSIKEQVPYKVTYTLTNVTAREPKAIAYSGEDFTLKLDTKYPGETIRSAQTSCSLDNSEACDFSFRDTTFTVNAEFITKDFDFSLKVLMGCEENSMQYTLDMDNKLAETFYYEEGNIDSSPLVVIPQNFTYKNVSYTVKKIGYQTFGRVSGDASTITSVTIPGSITYIGWNAFDKCSKLTEIHLKDKSLAAVKLETDCFKGINTGKCTVYVPKGTKANFSSTGWKVFEIVESDEYSVTKALANLKGTIPENAKRGKDFTFTLEKKGGQDIAELALEIRIADKLIGTNDYTAPSPGPLGEFTIPAKAITGDVKITATGYIDYLDKSMTYHLDIDNKLGKTFGLSAGTSVTSYEIPQAITNGSISFAITTIGSRTFKEATNLTSVTIPGSIKVIEDEVFDGCRNLTAIYLKDVSLATATVSANSFKGMDKTKCTVFVPKGSDKAAFAKVWSGFKDIKDSDQCTITCTVSPNIEKMTLSPVKIGEKLEFTLKLVDNHPQEVNLPDSITINGVKTADWFTYDSKTGKVSIPKVETDLVIKATEFVQKVEIKEDAKELKDQVIKEVEISKDQKVELTLTGVESETINVVEGADATIKLAGEVNLGTVTNSGTMTLDAAEGTDVKYTSIENKGVFTDNTGSITSVTGDAALEITPQPASSEIKPGGKLTVEAGTPGTDDAVVSYVWEKQETDGSWTQKKPLKETKSPLLTTKSALSLRAVEADNELTINKGDEGTYRCKVKREVEIEVNGVKTAVITTLVTKTEVTTKADEPSVPSISNYSITLPSVEGAATNPSAGLYTVAEGESFAFTLTLSKEYDQSKPVVKAGDQVIDPAAAGKYEIISVYSDLTISITGITKNAPPVGNAEVENDPVRAWGTDGILHIYSAQPETAYIISFGGKYKRVSVMGEIAITDMPRGAYVVRIKDKSFKIAL